MDTLEKKINSLFFAQSAMKRLIIFFITIVLPQTALALECKEKQNSYQVQKCDNQKLCITNNGRGQTILLVKHRTHK